MRLKLIGLIVSGFLLVTPPLRAQSSNQNNYWSTGITTAIGLISTGILILVWRGGMATILDSFNKSQDDKFDRLTAQIEKQTSAIIETNKRLNQWIEKTDERLDEHNSALSIIAGRLDNLSNRVETSGTAFQNHIQSQERMLTANYRADVNGLRSSLTEEWTAKFASLDKRIQDLAYEIHLMRVRWDNNKKEGEK